jgi:acyl-CoA synthetase (AMP-forming)/AMP-acid ligase II
MTIQNGYDVYPREVEEVLGNHPDVSSPAVYGMTGKGCFDALGGPHPD